MYVFVVPVLVGYWCTQAQLQFSCIDCDMAWANKNSSVSSVCAACCAAWSLALSLNALAN